MEQNDEENVEISRLNRRNFRLKIAVGVMVFLCLIFFVYAFVQKGIADENLMEAYKQRALAIEQAKIAEEQKMKTEQCADAARKLQLAAAQSAEMARRAAEDALNKRLKK